MQLNCTVAVVKCSWKGPFVVLALLSSLSEACTQFWRWTLWTPHWGIMILLCSIAQLHFKVFLIGTNNILWNCGYFAMWCKLRTPHWYMRISNDLDDTPQLIYLELQWRHARINNPYLYIIRWHINAKYANLYVMQLGWSIGVCNLIRFWAVEGLKLFLAIVWTASPSMHSFVWCRPVETSGGHLIWYSSQQVAIPEYHVSQLQGLHNIWVTSVWHVWEWIESAIISKMERVSSVCLIQLWQKVLWFIYPPQVCAPCNLQAFLQAHKLHKGLVLQVCWSSGATPNCWIIRDIFHLAVLNCKERSAGKGLNPTRFSHQPSPTNPAT